MTVKRPLTQVIAIFSVGAFFLLLGALSVIGCDSHRGKNRGVSSKRDTATAYISPVEFNPIINVYIENSGSMDGYVKGQTDFEHIVYNYLVDLKQIRIAKELNLNYINSQILPQQDDINDFIEKLEPSSFKAKGGNRGASDINDISS